MRPERIEPGPGQESVWDYPRPPAVTPVVRHIVVKFAGQTVAETSSAFKVTETSHPPVYYIPPHDVRADLLEESAHHSVCEHKGRASYYSLRVGHQVAHNAAWFYPEPNRGYEALAGHVAFFADRVDECLLDGERVTPQGGHFYGGWITSDVVGPFKGGPGTLGW